MLSLSYLVAKSLIQWARQLDGLVAKVVFLMIGASYLITRDIIPMARAALPMTKAMFWQPMSIVRSPKLLFQYPRQSLSLIIGETR